VTPRGSRNKAQPITTRASRYATISGTATVRAPVPESKLCSVRSTVPTATKIEATAIADQNWATVRATPGRRAVEKQTPADSITVTRPGSHPTCTGPAGAASRATNHTTATPVIADAAGTG